MACRRLEWERGIVSGRVDLYLRSTEIQPQFCDLFWECACKGEYFHWNESFISFCEESMWWVKGSKGSIIEEYSTKWKETSLEPKKCLIGQLTMLSISQVHWLQVETCTAVEESSLKNYVFIFGLGDASKTCIFHINDGSAHVIQDCI